MFLYLFQLMEKFGVPAMLIYLCAFARHALHSFERTFSVSFDLYLLLAQN